MTFGADVSRSVAWELVDTHAHLVDDALRGQIVELLSRAAEAGVSQVLAIGTTAEDSEQTLTLARENVGVYAAVGIQPNRAAEAKEGDWERILKLVSDPRVKAIGETGLDRYWDFTPFAMQQDYFERHLELARERNLPVVIHCRDCERDIVTQLERFGPPIRGVLHSFTGTWDDAEAFLELGLDVSFAGMVTFTNKKLDGLRAVAAKVPLDRLLVETDSPYLSPHPARGQTNEPARVVWTARRISELRGLELETLAQATTANAQRLFALPIDNRLGR